MGGACDHGTGSRGDNQVIWGVSLSMRACSIADAPDLSFEPLIYQPCQHRASAAARAPGWSGVAAPPRQSA